MAASRLPEYSSLVVSTVNGKATGNITSIFCHSVTCLDAGIGNICQGMFMNVPQYLLVKVQLVIRFHRSLSHVHLQPARGFALQTESKKLFTDKKGGF